MIPPLPSPPTHRDVVAPLLLSGLPLLMNVSAEGVSVIDVGVIPSSPASGPDAFEELHETSATEKRTRDQGVALMVLRKCNRKTARERVKSRPSTALPRGRLDRQDIPVAVPIPRSIGAAPGIEASPVGTVRQRCTRRPSCVCERSCPRPSAWPFWRAVSWLVAFRGGAAIRQARPAAAAAEPPGRPERPAPPERLASPERWAPPERWAADCRAPPERQAPRERPPAEAVPGERRVPPDAGAPAE